MHRVALPAALLLTTACAAIPDLRYASDDAAAPTANDAAAGDDGSASDGAAKDATPVTSDAAADSGTADSGACGTGTPPAGATTCCGNTPCVDRSGNGCDCAACAQLACSVWCCINSNQKAVCKNNAASCK